MTTILKDSYKTNDDIDLNASFTNSDTIVGKINMSRIKSKQTTQLDIQYGGKLNRTVGSLAVEIDKCECFIVHYVHPEYKRHDTNLLSNVTLPRRQVEDFEIFHIKRKFF